MLQKKSQGLPGPWTNNACSFSQTDIRVTQSAPRVLQSLRDAVKGEADR